MTTGWIVRGLTIKFAVLVTLAVSGTPAPAETFNGIPFVPPTADWRRSVSPVGDVYYDFRHDTGGGCRLAVVGPFPVADGSFLAWFDQHRQAVWEVAKPDVGGSDDMLWDVFEGIAKDGSEILSSDSILSTHKDDDSK